MGPRVVAGVELLALSLMAVIIHRRVARPMRRVTGAVAAAGADPTARIQEEGPKELQELSRSFNHLLDVRSEAIATSVRHSALRRLDAVVKVAPAGIVTADRNGRIIDWNPASRNPSASSTWAASCRHTSPGRRRASRRDGRRVARP